MNTAQTEKEQLMAKIAATESQLFKASKEFNSWNTGKYKPSGNARMSKVLTDSLRKELLVLRTQFAELNKASI